MKKFYRQLYRQRYLILMMLPGLLWFLIFKYCTYAGLGLAFTNYGFKKSVDFVGLRNFNRLFKSAQFWTAFKNTMIISICNIVFYFPFPIIIALLINELRSLRTKRAVQFMIYIPYFFSWVVVGTIFVNILSPSSGVVNQILNALGQDSIYFMADPKWFRAVLIVSYIWRQMGYGAVIYVATLSTVDPQLYEAAAIDGCNKWQLFYKIILPIAKPAIATLFITDFLSTWNEYLLASVIINDNAMKTVPVGIMTFVGEHGTDYGYLCAGVLVSVIPVMVVYLIFQRYFVEGMAGAVKS